MHAARVNWPLHIVHTGRGMNWPPTHRSFCGDGIGAKPYPLPFFITKSTHVGYDLAV
jgi:hypothetical protein